MDTRQLFVGIWGTQEIMQRQVDGCETALEPRPALASRPNSRRSGTDRVAARGVLRWMRMWCRGESRSLDPRPQC
jgi:hypothetical protein